MNSSSIFLISSRLDMEAKNITPDRLLRNGALIWRSDCESRITLTL